MTTSRSVEERLRAIEDRLEIYNIIASHPPSADTGGSEHISASWVEAGVFDRGDDATRGRAAIAGQVLSPAHQAAIAGGIALSILMIPIVMLTAEEAIRMVPAKMREAAIGMGATQAQTVWTVLFPTAMPGMLTGIMLAVARAAGETAPLLFTALFSNYWAEGVGRPTASLAVLIYNFSGSPFDNQRDMAWAAALVLALLVLTTNIIGQSLSRKTV